MKKIKFGCFGDDFTGASDAASFLKRAGFSPVLIKDIPDDKFIMPENADCAVIALKIRTIPAQEAVDKALAAYAWLKKHGAEHIYYKYCSTFDSTDKGNIGPIIDAIFEKYGIKTTILCPALPVNKRTVQDGHLYVDGIPLNETHMKNHPLTPMKSSSIPVLMSKQGKYSCKIISHEELAGDTLQILSNHNNYLVPDYTCDEDGINIAKHFHTLEFLTGGSGILAHFGIYYLDDAAQTANNEAKADKSGKAILLAGSCSVATLGQITNFIANGGSAIKISPETLFESDSNFDTKIWQEIEALDAEAVLVYSSATPEAVKKVQAIYGAEAVSNKLETLMADLAVMAVAHNYNKIIVAGGETSGAVTEALNDSAYMIGQEIAPGVPIMDPVGHNGLRIALKSGNFGDAEFFEKAIALMNGEKYE